jgi:uncharacterized protein (UPF0332 family)
MGDKKYELAKQRMEKAKNRLADAENNYERGAYETSVNRSYYAIYAAAKSLLATKGLDSSKHSGVISLFNLHFVKTGIVSKEISAIIINAREVRVKSDYEDWAEVTQEEAKFQLENADKFVAEIERALSDKLSSEE